MAYEVGSTQQHVQFYVDERRRWIDDAKEIVGFSRDADPLLVFPEASEDRSNSPALSGLSPNENDALRDIAARFGIGSQEDVVSGAKTQIHDGGKVWKMEAQARLCSGAARIILAGTSERQIDDEERAHMATLMGITVEADTSEFSILPYIAATIPNYEPLDTAETQPIGYAVSRAAITFLHEPTEQFQKIGQSGETEVFTLALDRLNFRRPNGDKGYKHLDTTNQLQLIQHYLLASGVEEPSIGFNSSNTYPSRAIDAVRAAYFSGLACVPGMYGRKTLAEVRGLEVGKPPAINQITGEFNVIHKKLLALQAALDASQV